MDYNRIIETTQLWKTKISLSADGFLYFAHASVHSRLVVLHKAIGFYPYRIAVQSKLHGDSCNSAVVQRAFWAQNNNPSEMVISCTPTALIELWNFTFLVNKLN